MTVSPTHHFRGSADTPTVNIVRRCCQFRLRIAIFRDVEQPYICRPALPFHGAVFADAREGSVTSPLRFKLYCSTTVCPLSLSAVNVVLLSSPGQFLRSYSTLTCNLHQPLTRGLETISCKSIGTSINDVYGLLAAHIPTQLSPQTKHPKKRAVYGYCVVLLRAHGLNTITRLL
jgi:hypothetical protein